MKKSKFLSRRLFIQRTALATAALPIFGIAHSRGAGANEKLQHACIGVGGMGANDFQMFLKHPRVQVVALCDVDEGTLKKAAEAAPGARLYRDWRELLAKENVDSINIAVPDHSHFLIAMSGIGKGKHVYCQKPLCHDVAEVRALTEASIKAGVITQLGTQMASSIGDRTAVSLLRAGAVGKVKRVVLCANRPGAIENYRLPGPRPAQGEPPPATLDWNLWLGSAPERPFAKDIYHPTKWRAWQDFGTGWSGDIGCHIFDSVWKGLRMEAPLSVRADVQESWAKSPARRADTWPQSQHITWNFPGNDLTGGKEWIAEWYDGEWFPPKEVQGLFTAADYPTESAMVLGTEGAMLIPMGSRPYLLPEEKFKSYPQPKFEARDHYHHFIGACLGGEKTESHFGQSGPMTEAILLGTIAIRVPGEKLVWNAKEMTIPNNRAAEKFLRRSYRDGWKVL
jgi:predicted dehydrogenase